MPDTKHKAIILLKDRRKGEVKGSGDGLWGEEARVSEQKVETVTNG